MFTNTPPSFGAALDGFRVYQNVELGLSPNTIGAYRRDLQRLGDYLRRRGIDDWEQITPQSLQPYLIELTDCGYREVDDCAACGGDAYVAALVAHDAADQHGPDDAD